MVNYTIGDALNKGIALLNNNQIDTSSVDASVILCHILSCDRLYLVVHRNEPLSDSDADAFFAMIGRRCQKEPVSYIVGSKEFMSLDFVVNTDVLIPRPDTEILVEKVIELVGNGKANIIDMCTGSGAIAVSLAKYISGSVVTALDISDKALTVAKQNADNNGVKVEFVHHDVRLPYYASADVVVSNPPYIISKDIEGLETNVKGFEPHLALDGGEDGLDFYRAIIQNIRHSLIDGGILAFEVGMGQADDVAQLMSSQFKGICIQKDLANIERVVYGYLDLRKK